MSQEQDQSRAEIEHAVGSLRRNQELLEMGIKPIAQMYFTRYKALLEAGFTEEQAFQLVLHRGME